jgi:hypothetical protein
MIIARSGRVRVSAPTPGAITAPRRCTARRRRIVAPIPARAWYLLAVAIDVIPTFLGGTSGEQGATAKQSANAESADNREQHHRSKGKVLTHIRLRSYPTKRADIWSGRFLPD